LVCALGIGTEESWKNLLAGVSGVATITSFDTPVSIAASAAKSKASTLSNGLKKKN